MQLLIATRNRHKTAEIRAILGERFEITDLTAHPEIPEVEETGSTFAENAALKALAASRIWPGLVLADDSGLEVDALAGAPGVFSARYAGPSADDAANRAKLRSALAALGNENPQPARFRCVITLARAGVPLGNFEGTVEGTVISEERGQLGFGYDALFVPDGYDRTFAEIGPETKNQLSHRARALAAALRRLTSFPYSTR